MSPQQMMMIQQQQMAMLQAMRARQNGNPAEGQGQMDPAAMQQMMGGGAEPGQGKKRKAQVLEAQNEEMHPKSRLSYGLALVLKRSLTKADLAFNMAEEEGGYRATLFIVKRGLTFVSDVQPTKKLAEASASQAALDALMVEITAAEEAHRAAKKAKKREQNNKKAEKNPHGLPSEVQHLR